VEVQPGHDIGNGFRIARYRRGCIPDAEPISWDGDFHGRLTPGGASGVLHMTSDTGLRLRATWMSPGAVDPTVGTLQMSVSGVVTGDV